MPQPLLIIRTTKQAIEIMLLCMAVMALVGAYFVFVEGVEPLKFLLLVGTMQGAGMLALGFIGWAIEKRVSITVDREMGMELLSVLRTYQSPKQQEALKSNPYLQGAGETVETMLKALDITPRQFESMVGEAKKRRANEDHQ